MAETRFDVQSKFSKEDIKEYIKRIQEIHLQVSEIYKDCTGEIDPRPLIKCSFCEKETNQYYCNWKENKHIHFCCEHCGMNFMQ
ncbi:hypothetical protein [Brevibacillus laterosporus]|uniref:hypothetical protein n=1 Tax=Brevibacillus laterosporus TaxID=1465 RepID=UPI001EF2BA60|nr:hypothetical protein [Brevibacillus laterosporus]MCG7317988.1 hypothetical protein [Brevibacillus laterosporus]